ncbi:unnamed protein product [Rotaria sp. Silwood2]|nr:unnamed protein product [Rotaria sp. Silwood2]
MDENGSLYVVDYGKDEVRRYRRGESQGTVVAGGNGRGNRFDQLSSPAYVFVDRDHSVYISDCGNDRVMKWVKGAKQGIVVAGGQEHGNDLTQLSYPQGVVVDQLGTVYVADAENDRIMRWPKEGTQGGVIIGGNSEGEQSNQLNWPIVAGNTPTPSGSIRNGQPVTNANSAKTSSSKVSEQQYFRVPFIYSNDQTRETNDEQKQKGWRYAHFDGKWAARQMEIHPNKEAIRVTGVNGTDMCELSLDETGLTSKKSAEILEIDFEQEWLKHGGREYLNSHSGRISSKYVVQLLQNYR